MGACDTPGTLIVALIVPHLAAKRLTGSTQSVHKETRHTGV
jgi:hypothetical protein